VCDVTGANLTCTLTNGPATLFLVEDWDAVSEYEAWGDLNGTKFCCPMEDQCTVATITVTGTDQADSIALTYSGGTYNLQPTCGTRSITVTVNAGGTGTGAPADTVGGSYYSGADYGETLNGEGGNDTLNGGDGYDVMLGGAGQDVMNGNNHDDVMHGGPDADTMDGGPGADEMHGDGGDDTMSGGTEGDTLCGDAHVVGDTLNDGDVNDDGDILWCADTGETCNCQHSHTVVDTRCTQSIGPCITTTTKPTQCN
jgi:hypothetical protein